MGIELGRNGVAFASGPLSLKSAGPQDARSARRVSSIRNSVIGPSLAGINNTCQPRKLRTAPHVNGW